MPLLERLQALLPPDAAHRLRARSEAVSEIRLRAGRPAQLVCVDGDEMAGEAIDGVSLRRIVSSLLEYSVYAREDELARGFFTLEDGSRVGVCGRRYRGEEGCRLGEIGSVCVRVARAVPGCADALMDRIDGEGGVLSTLLVSPPGMGKTTLLRDVARQLSERGYSVGIADERHELAACCRGVPTLDVGPRTDVMDGCARQTALRQMVRSMAPDVIVADELGGKRDARALVDAARCGVAVIASAHAESLEGAALRGALGAVLESGVIRLAVLLGGRPGRIMEVRRVEAARREGAAWRFA
ncbi:MAG: Flp pilus assembly complex ATPase component TadA [Clostridia bacterium]|nr:Flp pilus assembly complex ATPase component TadA [Clostridia bacterium]